MTDSAYPAGVSPLTRQTRLEDLINSVTHGLGLLLAIGAAAVLITLGAVWGTAWHVVSFSIYGASLILLYGTSTLYHGTRHVRGKQVLQIVDHASIYVLIAGTYTPFTLVSLAGGWGWSLFGVQWGLAAVGIGAKLFLAARFEVLSTVAYVAMGWLIVVAIGPLVDNLATGGIVWLLIGGLSYTIGAGFYHLHKLPFHHAVFHLFVLGGSVCQYFAVLFYVLDAG